MAESVLARARRLVGAGVETALGAAERASGTSLMRQALREIDDAIEDLRKRKNDAHRRGLHLAERQRMAGERIARLAEQARFALREGREELAEAAIAEQIALEEQVGALSTARDESVADEQRAEAAVADLTIRRTRMAAELKTYESAVAVGAGGVPGKAERRGARAEAAFERALAGGDDKLATPTGTQRVTEIDILQRERAAADRLAAMRAENEDEPSVKKSRKRG